MDTKKKVMGGIGAAVVTGAVAIASLLSQQAPKTPEVASPTTIPTPVQVVATLTPAQKPTAVPAPKPTETVKKKIVINVNLPEPTNEPISSVTPKPTEYKEVGAYEIKSVTSLSADFIPRFNIDNWYAYALYLGDELVGEHKKSATEISMADILAGNIKTGIRSIPHIFKQSNVNIRVFDVSGNELFIAKLVNGKLMQEVAFDEQ